MVDYAVAGAVDLVLLSGDVIDRDNRYYEASGALQEGFARLRDNGIKVFMVSGNHDFDVLPQVLRNHPFDNVHLLGAGGRWEAKRYERPGEAIQLVGWSYPEQYVLVNPLPQLALLPLDPNLKRIGLVHADVDNLESRYGPVPLADLQTADVDAWMLGHIHKPLTFGGSKIIRYPGSPQSLSAKEPGAHGALLLTVNGSQAIEATAVDFSNCRFERLQVDITTVDSKESLRGLIETELSVNANDRLAELGGVAYLVYDLYLMGQHSKAREIREWADPILNSNDLTLATGTRLYVRGITTAIRPTVENLDLLANENSPAGLLAQTILAIRYGNTTPFLEGLVREWERQFRGITNSPVYQPLQDGWQRNGNPRKAKDFIAAECNRLLAELLFPVN